VYIRYAGGIELLTLLYGPLYPQCLCIFVVATFQYLFGQLFGQITMKRFGYNGELRKLSKGLDTGLPEDFAHAESLHKTALTYDLRVGDMIRRGAVSKETPATP